MYTNLYSLQEKPANEWAGCSKPFDDFDAVVREIYDFERTKKERLQLLK
jgi:hypothetical protein